MQEESTVTVRVAQGELRGRRRRTVWGLPFVSFHGIPYAAPPIGPLRFKPPQPAPAWSGVRDATKEGNVAPQINILEGKYEGDEDCLFLNIYTPTLPSEGSGSLLPVMFMVHGGGLMGGCGNESWSGPDYLLQHGVVMVTFNYRLGVLGFLSTGDNVVPGNMGFKDQVMALRWVRDNIASFGGDPDNITIFGISAGGWSCHAFVLSPMAKGLFRRAIAQSGVVNGDGVCTERVQARSFALGAHLGLRTDNSKELVDFLLKQPTKVLIESAMHARSEEDKARCVMFPFVGTVEPTDAEGGAFFPRHPMEIMSSGDFQQVPFITGVCDFEGSVFTSAYFMEPKLISNAAENHRLLVPTDLPCSEDDKNAVAEEIRRFYFGDRAVGPDTMKELFALLGDLMFTYAAVKAAKIHSSKSSHPVYFYNFNVYKESILKASKGSFMDETNKLLQKLQVVGHGADGGCYLRSDMFGDVPEPGSADAKLIHKMTRLWTNFAKTGQPTDAELGVSWPAFTAEDGAYLHVHSEGLSVAHWPFKERVAFWDNIYSRYGK